MYIDADIPMNEYMRNGRVYIIHSGADSVVKYSSLPTARPNISWASMSAVPTISKEYVLKMGDRSQLHKYGG